MTRTSWSAVVVMVMAGCSSGDDAPATDAAAIDTPAIDTPAIEPIDARVIDAPPDAPLPPGDNPGFVLPAAITKANEKTGNVWLELGDADWTCLGAASTDLPPSGTIALSGTVADFQTGTGVGAASVNAFAISAPATSLGSTTSAGGGSYATTLQPLPSGVRRYGVSVGAAGYLQTFNLDRYLPPGAPRTANLAAFSEGTASALPAFVGITRDVTRALVIGSMVDCQGHQVSNAVVTVSTAAGAVQQPAGMNTFYFSASSSSLPVRHTQAPVMNKDGLFMILDVPPMTVGYLQVWGFRTNAELTSGQMTLLAQLAAPAVANTVDNTALAPRRAP